MLARVLVALVGVFHFGFMALEMFFWTKPVGLRVFKQSLETAQKSAVLAANQGLYNGVLASGLIWSAVHPDPEMARQISIFFLCGVIVVGLYGGFSAAKGIIFVQALPAAIALAAVLFI